MTQEWEGFIIMYLRAVSPSNASRQKLPQNDESEFKFEDHSGDYDEKMKMSKAMMSGSVGFGSMKERGF